MRRRVQVTLSVVFAVVLAVAALVWLTSGDKSSTQAPSKAETFATSQLAVREAQSLTPAEKRQLTTAAVNDPRVRQLTATHSPKVTAFYPWGEEDGSKPEGAGVYIRLQPPLVLRQTPLPVFLVPNEAAPPNTPILRRHAIYTATNVSVLKVRTLLKQLEVVEIEPMGWHIHITAAHLLGPTPSNAYRSEGD